MTSSLSYAESQPLCPPPSLRYLRVGIEPPVAGLTAAGYSSPSAFGSSLSRATLQTVCGSSVPEIHILVPWRFALPDRGGLKRRPTRRRADRFLILEFQISRFVFRKEKGPAVKPGL